MHHAPERDGIGGGRLRVLLVSSQGGHLTHLLALRAWWSSYDRLWVCPPTPDVLERLEEEALQRSYHPTTRNLRNLLRNVVLAFRVHRSFRPDLVVSSGAGVALPFFVVAWLRRIPTIYIEVYDRIDNASLTGKLCAPFTTVQVLQWEEQRRLYPDGVVVGGLL